MNEVQKVLLTLLDEIDRFCVDQGIRYSLADRIAWSAVKYGRFCDETYDAVVSMPLEDMLAFCSYIESHPTINRELEIVCVDPSIGSNGMRYIASDTLLVDLNVKDCSDCLEIAVDIKAMVPCEGGYSYFGPHGSKMLLAEDIFDELDRVVFEGRSYSIFKEVDTFFSLLVGSNWRAVKYDGPIRRVEFGVIADATIPYGEFVAAAHESGLCIRDITMSRQDFVGWLHDELKPIEEDIIEHCLILKRTGERFRLFEKYYPHKTEILALWEVGNLEKLEIAFQDYLRVLKEFYRKGLTVCFDVDLFEIAVALLQWEGFSEAKLLPSLVPKTHRINLGETLKGL